jgi:hypothetical protein
MKPGGCIIGRIHFLYLFFPTPSSHLEILPHLCCLLNWSVVLVLLLQIVGQLLIFNTNTNKLLSSIYHAASFKGVQIWVNIIFFVDVLAVLGFDFRALCLLGKYSTTWFMLPALYCFGYFSDTVSLFCPGLAWTQILFLYLLHSGVDIAHTTTPSLFVEMEVLITFWTVILLISTSQVAGFTGMNYSGGRYLY